MHEMLLMARSFGMVFIVMPSNTNADAIHPRMFVISQLLDAWQAPVAFPNALHIA